MIFIKPVDFLKVSEEKFLVYLINHSTYEKKYANGRTYSDTVKKIEIAFADEHGNFYLADFVI